MKATELMPKNYLFNRDKEIEQVWGLDVWYDPPQINNEFEDNYIPIPLTEEWLKKAGFKKMELKYLSGIKTGWILEDDTLYPFILGEYFQPIIQINGFSENIDIGSPLMFLHRLQNCYYVLKEKELIIK